MSTYIGAFHTYGLLLTEKLAALLLENAKKNWILLNLIPMRKSKIMRNPWNLQSIWKMRMLRLVSATQSVTKSLDSMTTNIVVWTMLRRSNSLLIELKHFPSLFSKPYNAFEDIIDEVQEQLYNLLPNDFSFNEYLVEIKGVIIG